MLGAVVFSTVAIQASDMVRNIDGNLAALTGADMSACGEGSVLLHLSSGALCVDLYEASAAEGCPTRSPSNTLQSQENLNDYNCTTVSREEMTPWRYV